jgi:sugar (pentulose or hexulose) kinase
MRFKAVGNLVPSFLTIDVGSSRIRAALFSCEGVLLAEHARPAPAEAPEPDHATINPEQLWREVIAAVGALGEQRREAHGVGVTALLSLVALDAAHEPVCDAMLWPDRRAISEAEEMNAEAAPRLLASIGRRFRPELAGPRLRWLARHRPDAFGRVAHLASLKDYVVLRLTGALLTDHTNASYSGLFDVERLEWSPHAARLAGVSVDVFPPALPSTHLAGRLTRHAAQTLGLREGVAVAVSASDGTVGSLGAGAIRAGVTVDIAGTTDVILHIAERPVCDPEGSAIVNAHAVKGLWAVGGATGLTGGAVAWAANLLGYASVGAAKRALAEELARIPVGSDGLSFRTSLSGARFPDWRPNERGLISGVEPRHGPAHLLAAAEEGASIVVANGLEALRRCGVTVRELIVGGGLAGDANALKRRADILGLPILAVSERETSSIGAAMLAGVVSGVFPDLESAAKIFVRYGRRYAPRGIAGPPPIGEAERLGALANLVEG